MKIKKSILFTALFAIVFVANAQTTPEPNWVKLGTSESLIISVDKASLKRNGDIVTAWESYVDKKEKKSTKILSEYNCKTNQTKSLSATVYPNMEFSGRPITYPPQKEWSYVVRETLGEDLIGYACKNAPKGLMDYFK
jgi:hypothetical protein